MCESKESTIQSQYLVVDGLRWVLLITCYLISITYRRRNMTALQDRLTRAKDMALKILQDTVYQMVERIPECSNTAVKGAELEGYIEHRLSINEEGGGALAILCLCTAPCPVD